MSNPVEFYKSLGWYITSGFGPRVINGKHSNHRGIDFGGFPCGAPVQTPFDGTVVATRTSGMGTWGNTVCVQISPDYVTLNAHLQKINVREGQKVKAGDIIGTNGGTTHTGVTYSCHIHFEVLRNNGSAPWRGDVWGDPAKFNLVEPAFSTKFKAGDKIRNKLSGTSVNVRADYGVTGKVLNTVGPREVVEVLAHDSNGIYNTGYFWFYVLNGWVAEDFFEKVEPEIEKPPTVEMPTELLDKLREVYELLKDLFE